MKTIYFIKPVGHAGPIKIGCSMTPPKRLRDVEIWSPLLLEIIATAPGDHRQENHLHHMFADCRRHGEWFEPSCELLAFIACVKALGRLPPMEVPRTAEQYRARSEKTKISRRGEENLRNKYLLTREVRLSEIHAFGFEAAADLRPTEIAAIMKNYQGFASDLPTDAERAILADYATKLMQLPKSPRNLRDFAAWHTQIRERNVA